MKSLIIAAVAVAGVGMAGAPALAQTTSGPTLTSPEGYVNLGYTYLNPYDRDLGEVFGRGGLRFSPYWGVEGEFGGGVLGNHFATGPGVNSRVNLSEGIQAAGYGVAYLPLMNGKLDLLARVGYGETPLTVRTDAGPAATTAAISPGTMTVTSWNFGAGAQYMFTPKDGVRFDYTRREFQDNDPANPRDLDTYSISYVRKF